ncbi:hypothetical protein ACWGIU_08500 [Streptomyces sp. NPDC054840]
MVSLPEVRLDVDDVLALPARSGRQRPPGNPATTCCQAGAVLDALALSCTPGPYLPGEEPYDDVPEPVNSAVELRTDAATLAERLAAHDRIHGAGKTSRPPQPRSEGDRDAERDSARADLRKIAAREVRLGGPACRSWHRHTPRRASPSPGRGARPGPAA